MCLLEYLLLVVIVCVGGQLSLELHPNLDGCPYVGVLEQLSLVHRLNNDTSPSDDRGLSELLVYRLWHERAARGTTDTSLVVRHSQERVRQLRYLGRLG